MEFFSLLKIIIKNLDLSGWFKNWFHKTEANNQLTVNVYVNIPVERDPTIGSLEDAQKLVLEDTSKVVTFTKDQLYLIEKINQSHKLNGRNDYDFTEDYKWGLYYILHKPMEDWQYNAAIRIAQAMQDVDLFGVFEKIGDPEKKEEFQMLKRKINYLYNRIIQELRHTNKRGQIEKQFRAPYHNEMKKEPQISDSDYESIFQDYQNLLIELFSKFKLLQL